MIFTDTLQKEIWITSQSVGQMLLKLGKEEDVSSSPEPVVVNQLLHKCIRVH